MDICSRTKERRRRKCLSQKVDTDFLIGQTASDEKRNANANDDVLVIQWSDAHVLHDPVTDRIFNTQFL